MEASHSPKVPQPAGSGSPAGRAGPGTPRSSLRAAWRTGAAVGLTATFALRPLAVAAATLGRRDAVVRSGSRSFHALSRTLCPLFGFRVKLEGSLPPGPVLIAPNHLSYADVLVLARTADAVFVSRADVAGWPGIGPLSRLGGTIFVERERRRDAARAADEMGRALDRGLRVVVFPEGRAGDGRELRPFQSALLESACSRGVPCVPVAIRYDVPEGDAARDVAWADDTPFTSHAWNLLGVRTVTATMRVGAPRTGGDRKAMARDLGAAVADLLTSVPTPGR